jgi:indole-3-glycerol phosphate synthase
MDNRKLLEMIERAIKKLEEKRNKIKNEIKEQEIEEWKKRKEEGWIPFVLKTPYESNDGERGVIVDYYAFSPSHKNIEENLDLESFIKELKRDEDYYYFNDEYIFRAVWPEKYIDDDE